MNTEPLEATESSISEIGVLRIFLKNWWRPLAGSIVVAVVAGLYSLLWTRQYMAEAALVIREPQVPMTGEAAPLSIEMLEGLVKSDDVEYTVFDALRKGGVLPKGADFGDFQKDLEVAVEVKKGASTRGEPLPMLTLRVKSKNPEAAEKIANKWADVALDRCREIYAKGVTDLSVFVGEAYKSAEETLTKNEDFLTSQTLAANLDMKKARFQRLRDDAIAAEGELIALDNDILTTKALIQSLDKRISDQEVGKYWAGNYMEILLRSDDAVTTEELRRRGVKLSTRSLEIVEAVRDIVAEERALVKEKEKRGYVKKENRLAVLRKSSAEAATSITLEETRLQQATDRANDTLRILSPQQSDGRFAGELLEEYYRSSFQPFSLSGTTITLPAKPELTTRTRELDDVVRNLYGRRAALAKYEEESGVKFKESRLKILEEEYPKILTDLAEAKKLFAVDRAKLDALTAQLEKEPEKIVLRKAITDDALWASHLEKTDSKAAQTPLMTEDPNPVYQSLRESSAELSAETKAEAEKTSYLEQKEREVRGEIEALRKEVEWRNMAVSQQEEGILRYRQLLDDAKKSYSALQEEYSTLQRLRLDRQAYLEFLDRVNERITWDLLRLEEEMENMVAQFNIRTKAIQRQRSRLDLMYRDYSEQTTMRKMQELVLLKKEAERDVKAILLDKLTRESRALEEEVARDEREQRILNREIARVAATQANLATRSAEVENLKIAGQQASRTGAAILFRAGEKPAKVPLGRLRFVLAAWALGYLALAFLLVVREILQEDERRRGIREGVS